MSRNIHAMMFLSAKATKFSLNGQKILIESIERSVLKVISSIIFLLIYAQKYAGDRFWTVRSSDSVINLLNMFGKDLNVEGSQ